MRLVESRMDRISNMEKHENASDVVDLGDAIELTLGNAFGSQDSDGQGRQLTSGINVDD